VVDMRSYPRRRMTRGRYGSLLLSSYGTFLHNTSPVSRRFQ
jgi:hypothetical protein